MAVILVMTAMLPWSASAATRSVGLTVTPTTTVAGNAVRLTGGISPARAAVRVVLQHDNGRTWVSDRTVTTDAAGRYTAEAHPGIVGERRYRVVVPRQAWGLRTVSRPRRVTVLRRAGLTVSAPQKVRSDEELSVRGSLSVKGSGSLIRLERHAGSWQSVGSATTVASGRFHLTAAPRAGTYRVVAPRRGLRATARSAAFSVSQIRVRTAGGTVKNSTSWTTATRDEVELTSDLVIPRGRSLTIGAGVTIVTRGYAITVRGHLTAGQGGRTVFESRRGTSKASQWPGLTIAADATADLGRSLVKGAIVALDVNESASATWHGTVRSARTGVIGDGYVDARHLDWDSASGPTPYGSGIKVAGDQAHVVPWAGYTVPAAPTIAPAQPTPVCADVVVLAARGSNESPQGQSTYESDLYRGMGAPGYFTALGTEQFVQDTRSDTTFELRAIRFPSIQFPAFTSTVRWTTYVDGLMQGALGLRAAVRSLKAECPQSRVVLIGASQGAAVVRLGVNGLAASDRARIAGVGLIGDLTRTAGDPELVWQSANTPATGVMLQRSGFVAPTLMDAVDPPRLPDDIAARTLSLCLPTDIVCAAGPGTDINGHLQYSAADYTAMYQWLGRAVLRQLD